MLKSQNNTCPKATLHDRLRMIVGVGGDAVVEKMQLAR
jgi:hypothetical protein